MKKKIISLLLILILMFTSTMLCACSIINPPSDEEWAQEVEQMYNENKELFSDFVAFCYKEGIDYIHKGVESPGDTENVLIVLNRNYYVYSFKPLSKDIASQLSKYLKFFKKYKITDIYVSDDYFSGVLFGTGGFRYRLGLKYTKEIKTIEQIQKESFARVVRYIDDHWYIRYGDL